MSLLPSATDVTATAQPTEQEDNDDDNHEQSQNAAQSPTAIIPPTMTVVAATAKQQDEHDNKQYERRRMDILPSHATICLLLRRGLCWSFLIGITAVNWQRVWLGFGASQLLPPCHLPVGKRRSKVRHIPSHSTRRIGSPSRRERIDLDQ